MRNSLETSCSLAFNPHHVQRFDNCPTREFETQTICHEVGWSSVTYVWAEVLHWRGFFTNGCSHSYWGLVFCFLIGEDWEPGSNGTQSTWECDIDLITLHGEELKL